MNTSISIKHTIGITRTSIASEDVVVVFFIIRELFNTGLAKVEADVANASLSPVIEKALDSLETTIARKARNLGLGVSVRALAEALVRTLVDRPFVDKPH